MNTATAALANLMDQPWFAPARRPEIEETAAGGYTVWAEGETYRISPEGEVYRIYVRSGEVVFLD